LFQNLLLPKNCCSNSSAEYEAFVSKSSNEYEAFASKSSAKEEFVQKFSD
jgi:hypothetical protein